MSLLRGALCAALLAGCGSLPTEGEVAFLQVTIPKSNSIEVGATLQLEAVALDRLGNVLDVPITWRTPDTTVSVDETGLVEGLEVGTGRVQAAIGASRSLVSNFIEIKVTAPAEEPEPAHR